MRRRTLVIGSVVLGGAALVLFCCTGHGDRPANAPAESAPAATTAAVTAPPPSPTPGDSAGSTATAALANGPTEPGDAGAPPPSDAGATPASSARPGGPGALIAETVNTADPRDLELLAAIERDTRRDPPAQIHALIAARKRGATRDELTRDIRTLPDLRLRALALRWLDSVAPKPAAGTAR